MTVPRRYFFCGSFVCFFVSCVSHAYASVHCCLVVICWQRTDLLALVGDVYCIFVTFPCGILGLVSYLIVSFPDFSLLSYIYNVQFLKVEPRKRKPDFFVICVLCVSVLQSCLFPVIF